MKIIKEDREEQLQKKHYKNQEMQELLNKEQKKCGGTNYSRIEITVNL